MQYQFLFRTENLEYHNILPSAEVIIRWLRYVQCVDHIQMIMTRVEEDFYVNSSSALCRVEVDKGIHLYIQIKLHTWYNYDQLRNFASSQTICCLLITFANNSDLDQDRKNICPDLDSIFKENNRQIAQTVLFG